LYPELFETRCFIATALQLCFRICHYEGPRKPGGSENKWTHQQLVYADDVNLLGDNIYIYIYIYTIKRKKQSLFDASKEIGVEVNTEKTKYMLESRHQNEWQYQDMRISNRLIENVAQFRYLGMTIKN
jgi:hypothetical protein